MQAYHRDVRKSVKVIEEVTCGVDDNVKVTKQGANVLSPSYTYRHCFLLHTKTAMDQLKRLLLTHVAIAKRQG